MTRKVIKIWLGFAFTLIICIIIQSCCRPKNVEICNITLNTNLYDYSNFNLNELNQNLEDGMDTSYGQFSFNLLGDNIFEGDVCRNFIPFINTAYAFQPCENNVVDSITRSNITFSLNRDIIFNGQTITAGNDLMKHASIGSYLKYTYTTYSRYEGRLYIDSADYPLLQLSNGVYSVTVTTKSASGHSKIISKNILFQ